MDVDFIHYTYCSDTSDIFNAFWKFNAKCESFNQIFFSLLWFEIYKNFHPLQRALRVSVSLKKKSWNAFIIGWHERFTWMSDVLTFEGEKTFSLIEQTSRNCHWPKTFGHRTHSITSRITFRDIFTQKLFSLAFLCDYVGVIKSFGRIFFLEVFPKIQEPPKKSINALPAIFHFYRLSTIRERGMKWQQQEKSTKLPTRHWLWQ